ncbi:hypothetical protein C9I86_02925 [Photobacterium sp. NCIMB 13483]|nr:hypothetical protein C9I86_02925 [Photobacterium sp. NCIMB 13483]
MICNDIVLYSYDNKRNNQNKERAVSIAFTKITIIPTIILEELYGINIFMLSSIQSDIIMNKGNY